LTKLALEDVQERTARGATEDNDDTTVDLARAGIGGGPPYRLRDLRGRDLALALATLVLVVVPFVVALIRSWHDGWLPTWDQANIATRSLDVFSRHPPLTGLPSTSALYGDKISTNHPGPFEFYLIAVPLRLFGMRAGPLLTAGAINMSAVLVALWVIYRRAGIYAMLWASVLLQAFMWSAGTAVLVDTLSSNMQLYSVMCSAVLTWALVDGDIALLPLAVFVASYAAQQHLASTALVGTVVFVALVSLIVRVVRRARRGEKDVVRSYVRWGLIALGVAVVCWLPPMIDQATGHPGNITAIIQFARDNHRPTVGLRSGVTQAIRAIAPPTVLLQTDVSGLDVARHLDLSGRIAGVIIVALLLAVGVHAWRRCRALANLVVVTVVVLAAGTINGSNVPYSLEMWRINLYRWTWTAAFLTWLAIGWGLALVVAPLAARLSDAPKIRRLAPIALVVVAALFTTATATISGRDDHDPERQLFDIEPALGSAVLRNVDHKHPVVVSFSGPSATDIGFYIIFRLVQAGVPVEVPRFLSQDFDGHRKYTPSPNTPAIVLESSGAPLAPQAGRVIASHDFVDPEYSALVDQLVAEAGTQNIVWGPNAQQALIRDIPNAGNRKLLEIQLDNFSKNPRLTLTNDFFLKYVEEGIITSPHLDLAKVQRLRQLSAQQNNKVLGDEQVRIRLVPADQVGGSTVPGV
jgi:hypothetical protein